MAATIKLTDTEFFDRIEAAGFKGIICRTQPLSYSVEWTGHKETVHVLGGRKKGYEVTVVTSYATPEEAVEAAESI